MSKKRKVAIITGSDSDFPQCVDAVRYMREAEKNDLVEVFCHKPGKKVIVASIHRHGDRLRLDILPEMIRNKVDVIIAGAGWAAHLPGMLDSHLRYGTRNSEIVIIGVAFEDKDEPRHTHAAISSIDDVPGTQVVFDEQKHVGPSGMLHACKIAVQGEMPKIILPDPNKKPSGEYSWDEVLQIAEEKKK